jgi:hypothetical protein
MLAFALMHSAYRKRQRDCGFPDMVWARDRDVLACRTCFETAQPTPRIPGVFCLRRQGRPRPDVYKIAPFFPRTSG